MRLVPYVAVMALLTSACSDFGSNFGSNGFKHPPPIADHPFVNDQSQAVGCPATDQTCTSGGVNPSIRAPTRVREQDLRRSRLG